MVRGGAEELPNVPRDAAYRTAYCAARDFAEVRAAVRITRAVAQNRMAIVGSTMSGLMSPNVPDAGAH